MSPPPSQRRYETGAYGPPMPYDQPARGLSIASLVLGVLSFFLSLTFVVPIVGLVLGVMGLRREPAGRGLALAGIWINAILLALTVAFLLLVIVLLLFGVALIPDMLSTTTSTSDALA